MRLLAAGDGLAAHVAQGVVRGAWGRVTEGWVGDPELREDENTEREEEA